MLQIRPARRSDAEAAFDIRLQAIRHHCRTVYTDEQVKAWTAVPITERYRDWVKSDYHLGWVEGVPVATGLIDFQSGELGALFVLPAFMGQGVGKKMVSYLEQLARGAGLTEIHLEATLNATDFYHSCGFVGDRESIYHSPSGLELACVPMRKRLLNRRPA